jgi:hypothetical protein
MTPHLRRSILFAAALALTGALAPAPPEPANDIKALAREQVTLARQALQDLDRLYKGGEISVSDRAFPLWGQRLVQAVRTSGADKAEVVSSLENYLDQTKKLEQYARKAHEQGQATRVDVTEAQYRRLEAAIWLAEEKAR